MAMQKSHGFIYLKYCMFCQSMESRSKLILLFVPLVSVYIVKEDPERSEGRRWERSQKWNEKQGGDEGCVVSTE